MDDEEITPAMIDAGFRAFICDCGALIHREEAVRIYRAMRAARPIPAETEAERSLAWWEGVHGEGVP